MPGITEDMFKRTMNANYNNIKQKSEKLKKIFAKSKKFRIITEKGTDLTGKVPNRKAIGDTGIYNKKSDFGNLPAGEAGLAPLEGTTNGVLVVDASFLKRVDKPIKIIFKDGYAVKISGGKVANKLKRMLKSIKNKNAYAVGEFAIGLNKEAKITGKILEDEKVLGTAHIALGNNKSYGGKIDVPIHLDGVFKKPTIFVDNKKIMRNGKLLI